MRYDNSARAIRRDWLDEVVIESQLLAGRASFVDRDDAKPVLSAFVRSLPKPTTRVEWMVLQGVLIEVAHRYSSALHDRVHSGETQHCNFISTSPIDRFCRDPASDLAETFLKWLDAFFREFDARHPPSIAASVGELIRREYTSPWTVRILTRRFGVSPAQLRRAFKHEFGMSIPEYQRTVRIVSSIDELRIVKTDAVALRAGYRSKKNFYRAFNRLIGLTVNEFRKLPSERASEIQEAAKLRLFRRGLRTVCN